MSKRQHGSGFTRRDILKLGASAPLAALPMLSHAQDAYPVRGIDILYGFGPGSSGDLTCRIAAAWLRKKWHVPLNVINKPGGNTVPAVLDLYNAAPDGYTLLGDPPGSSSMLAAVVRNLPFKVAERTFIAMIASNNLMFVVNPLSPYKTLKDVADDAKRDPQSFTWASQGGAATADYIMRKFARLSGFDIAKTKPVTVRSQTEIATMAAGNQVKVGVVVIAAAQSAIQGGLIRPLALSASARAPNLPNVPTTAELGYPIDLPVWTGISGPPKLPAAVVAKWNGALQEMLKEPDVVAQLAKIGSVPRYLNAVEFRDYVLREAAEVEELYR